MGGGGGRAEEREREGEEVGGYSSLMDTNNDATF